MTETPQLNVEDITNAVKVIDYACENGAFKGWENIMNVKNVRDKLVIFLNAVAESQKANAPEIIPTPAPTLDLSVG